jgi:hypothetical protein
MYICCPEAGAVEYFSEIIAKGPAGEEYALKNA